MMGLKGWDDLGYLEWTVDSWFLNGSIQILCVPFSSPIPFIPYTHCISPNTYSVSQVHRTLLTINTAEHHRSNERF
jgi:hypothetical protein